TQEKANRESPDTKTSAPAPPQAEKAETAGAPQESKAPAAARDEKAEAAPPPAPPAKAPPGASLPDAEVLPDYKFAHAATDSPIVGGNADTRYFTIVYGMIRSHLRPPSGSSAAPPSRGGAVV